MSGITIKDVAIAAGVSIATVSRALNDPEKVRPATLSKIQHVAKQLNYGAFSLEMNPTFPGIFNHTPTKIIGFVVSDLCNSHFTFIARALEQSLKDENYTLVVCNSNNNPETERLQIEKLISLGIDGLAINSTCMNNDYIKNISHSLPTVLVARRITDFFTGDYVGSNNAGGVEQLTKHLIDMGHRKIGLINADTRFSTGQERLDGFINAMEKAHIPFDQSYLYTGNYFNEMDGIEGCQYLLARSPRPTAIVICNNSMAVGAYSYLKTQNMNVPEDISIVSFGSLDNGDLFKHVPTIVSLSPDYIGQKAALCLISRIQGKQLQSREIIYEPSLIAGDTVKSLY